MTMAEDVEPIKRAYRKKTARTVYTLSLPFGKTLEIKESANAWWVDQTKVYKLITAFSFAYKVEEACLASDITVKQYKYFVSLYPEFAEARKGYVLTPNLLAQKTLVEAIPGNLKMAWWWATHKMADQYGSPSRRTKRNAKMLKAKEGQQLQLEQGDPEFESACSELVVEYEKKLRDLVIQSIKRKSLGRQETSPR